MSQVTISSRGRRSLTAFFVVFIVVLYLPTTLLMIFSFNDATTQSWPPLGFTTHWFHDAYNDTELRKAFVNSLYVASICAVISTLIGLSVSLPLARRRFWFKGPVTALMLTPLVVPQIVLGVAILLLIRKGPRFDLFGFSPDDLLGLTAVIIGHCVLALPFVILLLLPRIAGIDRRLEEAAVDLGASSFLTFRRVMLPLIAPAIASSLMIAFVISFDEVVVASFVTSDEQTMPMFLYSSLKFPDKTARLLPVAFILIVISFALVMLATVLRVRGERRAVA